MNGDGVTLETWIDRVKASGGDRSMLTVWVVGIDPQGRRRVLWGAWPSDVMAKWRDDPDPEVQDQAAIAAATSLADRFHLEAEAGRA